MMGPKDLYGQVIEIGDYIQYPYTASHGADIRTGKVVAVKKTKDHLDREIDCLTVAALVDREVKTLTIKRLNKCTIIPKLYVQNNHEFYKLMMI